MRDEGRECGEQGRGPIWSVDWVGDRGHEPADLDQGAVWVEMERMREDMDQLVE